MSFEQIIKVILSVTTARRSLAGLMMICGIVLSLHFLDPMLKSFIPNAVEMTPFLCFLAGSFAGYLVYSALLKSYLSTLAWIKKLIEKKEEATRISKEEEQREQRIQESLSRFKSTYTHLGKKEIATLRLLTNKDGYPLRSDNYTLKQLARNHWVWKISELSSSIGVYKVHGYIAKYITEQWDTEINDNVNQFYCLDNPLKNSILNLLPKETDISDFEYDIHSFYDHKSDFPDIFIFSQVHGGGWITFEPRYQEALENKYSQVFKDSLYVKFF